jgi:hypothetical protein
LNFHDDCLSATSLLHRPLPRLEHLRQRKSVSEADNQDVVEEPVATAVASGPKLMLTTAGADRTIHATAFAMASLVPATDC